MNTTSFINGGLQNRSLVATVTHSPVAGYLSCRCTPAEHKLGCLYEVIWHGAGKHFNLRNHINAGANAVVLIYEKGKKAHCKYCGLPIGESWNKLEDHCGRYHYREDDAGWLTWDMPWQHLMWRNAAAVRVGAGYVCAVIPVMWKKWLKDHCPYYQPANRQQVAKDLKGEATKAVETFARLQREVDGTLFYSGHSS